MQQPRAVQPGEILLFPPLAAAGGRRLSRLGRVRKQSPCSNSPVLNLYAKATYVRRTLGSSTAAPEQGRAAGNLNALISNLSKTCLISRERNSSQIGRETRCRTRAPAEPPERCAGDFVAVLLSRTEQGKGVSSLSHADARNHGPRGSDLPPAPQSGAAPPAAAHRTLSQISLIWRAPHARYSYPPPACAGTCFSGIVGQPLRPP